jgi:hypothetical protein
MAAGEPVVPGRGATYEKGSMILNSNLAFGSWDEGFARDAVLTAAVLAHSGEVGQAFRCDVGR